METPIYSRFSVILFSEADKCDFLGWELVNGFPRTASLSPELVWGGQTFLQLARWPCLSITLLSFTMGTITAQPPVPGRDGQLNQGVVGTHRAGVKDSLGKAGVSSHACPEAGISRQMDG